MSISGGEIETSATRIGDTNRDVLSTQNIAKTKKAALLKKWRGRLKWAPKEISVFRQIVAVHSLVADLFEDLDSVLELVTLCRKEGMFTLCENTLRKLGYSYQIVKKSLINQLR